MLRNAYNVDINDNAMRGRNADSVLNAFEAAIMTAADRSAVVVKLIVLQIGEAVLTVHILLHIYISIYHIVYYMVAALSWKLFGSR